MFVKLGDRAINLDNVTQIFQSEDANEGMYIQIDFVGEGCERFYSDRSKSEYAILSTFIEKHTALLEVYHV